MAIGTQDDSDQMLSEINMIPFIDVMLVLLIIFIITVPVIRHAVNIELPRASNEKVLDTPKTCVFRWMPMVFTSGTRHVSKRPSLSNVSQLPPRRSPSLSCTSVATKRCATNVWPWPWRRLNARACTRSDSSWSRPQDPELCPSSRALRYQGFPTVCMRGSPGASGVGGPPVANVTT